MLKKIAFAGVGIALLASPLLASADTASEIQTKISGFLAQIARLQEQLGKLTPAGSTTIACTMEAKLCPDGTAVGRTGPNCEFAACPGTVVPSVGSICPQILRTLDRGIVGSDVKDLQAYLGVSQTGFFGPMTARAVAAFQAQEGLSQVGIVGPQTRAAFARRCGRGNQTFTASPSSGTAPVAPSCPVYSPPNCNENEQLVGGGVGNDGCELGPRCVPKTPATPGAPSINGIDGPAALGAGVTGLWTARASVPNDTNTQLRYSVIWGDEGVLDQIRAFGNTDAVAFQTTGTFTHAYARAGTFRPTFTVSNTAGSAQTSASVVVGGGDGTGSGNHCSTPGACVPKTTAAQTSAAGASCTVLGVTYANGQFIYSSPESLQRACINGVATLATGVIAFDRRNVQPASCSDYNGYSVPSGRTGVVNACGQTAASFISTGCETVVKLCQNGEWTQTASTPTSGGSCTTPGGVVVANGRTISSVPYFEENLSSTPLPIGPRLTQSSALMRCQKGAWLRCDAEGNNCAVGQDGSVTPLTPGFGTAERNANLANALAALESAIRALIANLGR